MVKRVLRGPLAKSQFRNWLGGGLVSDVPGKVFCWASGILCVCVLF